MHTTEFKADDKTTITVTGTAEKVHRLEIHGPNIDWVMTDEKLMPKELLERAKAYLAEEASL